MNIELLREQVLEKGKRTNDTRVIIEVMDLNNKIETYICNISEIAFSQISRDLAAQYKFYDALCMWLGQVSYFEPNDKQILIEIANTYLKET